MSYQFGDQTKLSTTSMRGGFYRGYHVERGDFREQDMRAADFYGASLQHVDAYGADLRQTNFGRADLRGATFEGANLRNADLSLATMHEANLRGADLRGARLWGADLSGCDLRDADLRLADLRQVRLDGAKLDGALLSPHQILPEEGAFIGWRFWGNLLFKFEIPDEVARTNSIGDRMGRAERVRILGVWDEEGERVPAGTTLEMDGLTIHVAYNAPIVAENFDDDPRASTGGGIPFFLTREEAIDH